MSFRQLFSLPWQKAAAAVLAVGVLGGSVNCAYYNKLYNAEQRYIETDRMPYGREGELTRQQVDGFEAAAAKALEMVAMYPDSRWVDDALLLVARCRLKQERYRICVETVDELERLYPKSGVLEEATFLRAKALVEDKRLERAYERLDAWVNKYKKSDYRPEALYYLSRTAISLERADAAVRARDELEKRYEGDEYRLAADMEVADVLAEQGKQDESLAIYESLASRRLPIDRRFEVWSRLAEAYAKVGRHGDALEYLGQAAVIPNLGNEERAERLLAVGQSQAAMDSIDAALATFAEVTNTFPRSKFSAEAAYRLGIVNQEQRDSLEVAKGHFEEVTRQYAGSDYASDAIKRSVNISKLIRLRDSEGENSAEARALREFSLAELQLFQFDNTTLAIQGYRTVLDSFPDSEFAPRAAYALGYIYGVVLDDNTRAEATYSMLQQRYPGTPQARFAGEFLAGSRPLPPSLSPAVETPPDTTNGE